MSIHGEKGNGEGLPMAALVDSAADLWISATKTWSGVLSGYQNMGEKVAGFSTGSESKMPKMWQSPFTMWQTFLPAKGEMPTPWDSSKAAGALHEMAMKMLLTGCEGCFELFSNWVKQARSFTALEQMVDAAGGKAMPASDYYKMWMRFLGDQYAMMFNTPGYLRPICQTLQTVQELKMTQHRWLADTLQKLPIPTIKDMDEVIKEIYLLKKQVKDLAKKMEASESKSAARNSKKS